MFLQVDQISVQYPGAGRPAVSHVSLGLARGQIGALIGPSGCGKTSLLRTVAGLERPVRGRVVLDGVAVSDPAQGVHVGAEARRIGMVFQDYALFPHLTVLDNVMFGLHRLPRTEQKTRAAQMLDLVGLGGAAKRHPHQLSGGQQQRIALARALAPQPRLLLMDEPFSSLDVDLRERLAQEVRAILKQTDTTALFVTHDQFEAFAVGDVIGVMQQGELQQWDEPYALYHRPATRFVAGFVGHGVFLPGQVVTGPAGVRVHTALGDWADAVECPLPGAGGACDVLLRADDIVHDDASAVKARIQAKAFRGAEFLYTLQLGSGEQVQALVPSHHDHAVGEWIGIRAEPDHVVTFPRSGG
jgi:iron(III) transport system ATP-binding protein